MNYYEHVECLNVCFSFTVCLIIIHLCMFYFKAFQFLCMYMFMGLVTRIVNGMVVSSSSVGGLGTLQCGIRAHVAAWASMGREESVTEASFPLPNKGKNEKIRENDRKISKRKNLSMKIIGWLTLKPIRYVG